VSDRIGCYNCIFWGRDGEATCDTAHRMCQRIGSITRQDAWCWYHYSAWLHRLEDTTVVQPVYRYDVHAT
jgi:hypothetical protein